MNSFFAFNALYVISLKISEHIFDRPRWWPFYHFSLIERL